MNFPAVPRLAWVIDELLTLRQTSVDPGPDPPVVCTAAAAAGLDAVLATFLGEGYGLLVADLAQLREIPGLQVGILVRPRPALLPLLLDAGVSHVCFVPGTRGETAPGGGLAVEALAAPLSAMISTLRESGVSVGISIDPQAKAVQLAADLGCTVVELICSGLGVAIRPFQVERRCASLAAAAAAATAKQLRVALRCGITSANANLLARLGGVDEVRVGSPLTAAALLQGAAGAVTDFYAAMRGNRG